MHKLRKYIEIAKTYMKSQLAWRSDVIFNMVFTVTKILFAYLLWSIIFADRNTVGQFTFSGMLSYYIVCSFLAQLEMSRGVSEEIHERIRNGTFTKYIVLPVNIEKYFLAMELGIVLFYLAFDFIASIVWVGVFNIQFTLTKDAFVLICALLMIIIGMIFMVQLNFLLGILTLKYQGIDTLLMIKDNLINLVTGVFIPLALFPEAVVKIMKLLPFYYVTYLPSMLLTGYCKQEALQGVVIILCWCIVIQLIIKVVWNKYIRKYDSVGI